MKSTIERATGEDLPAIAELARKIWRQHYPGIISHDQIDYMLKRLFDPVEMKCQITNGFHYEKLVCNSRLIGFASHGAATGDNGYKLDKLYVAADFQGKGFGKLLLEHVVKIARNRGSAFLFLTVNKQNKNAVAMYLRNGFEIRESVVKDISGGFVMDDHIMVRPL